MAITLNAFQQQRRDTASNWASNNPTLLAGEWAYETDTKKFKIGDGTTAYTSLDYVPIPDTNRLLAGNLTVGGNFTVNGTSTTIDTTTLTVEDKNIEIGKVSSPSDTTADGGGITLKAASDKTITWSNANDSWDFNQNINAASTYAYKINNVSVLNATTLGSSVVGSSLTSVGTIATGVWQGTAIGSSYMTAGTTSVVGAVQLTDSASSTSTTTAATPNAVKTAKDAADAAQTTANGKVASVSGTAPIVSSGGTTPAISITASSGSSAGSMSSADFTKLSGIEASADVTDATNVNAAGAIMESDVDAKGDLLAGTADNTVSRLAVGTDGYVLKADSSAATGLAWAVDAGGIPTSGGSFSGDVTLANQSDARFAEATANGSNYVGFQAPASVASNILWTLPATDAAVSGYALISDASGNLSWGEAGGGAKGGGGEQIFHESEVAMDNDYTISTNHNAVVPSPLTINATLTIPSGSVVTFV